MTDIWEYQTVVESVGCSLQLKGWADSSSPSNFYWLCVRVKPSKEFLGETELLVLKEDINQLVADLTQMHRDTKGCAAIKCTGWDSYINFDIGKFGELYVSGQLNKRWEGENNHLRFKLVSDQTIIPSLIQVLKEIITD